MADINTTDSQFRLANSVVDESFSQAKLDRYHLLLSVHKNALLVAVVDSDRNKVLVLEDYDLGRTYSTLQAAVQINLILQQHGWLLSGTWKQVRCEIHHSPYTLIPVALFDPEAMHRYFNLAGSHDPDHEKLLYYTHRTLEMVVLFSASNYLLEQINTVKSADKIRIVHGASAFIEGLLHSQPRNASTQTFILIGPQHATIVLLREGAVVFCNSFYFTTPEDFIYYVVLVMQEHQLNTDQDNVMVWGELTPDSALFAVLQKYIRNVTLGKRPTGLSYSYRVEDLFPHRYYDLFSLYLCNG